MQKIPLKLGRAGMKLAKPVVNEGGITIVAEGLELSDSLLSRLENMGIERIVVQGNPVDMGGVGEGTSFAQRLARLDHIFRGHSGDQWMEQVKGFLGEYFKVKAAAQEAAEESENGDNDENGVEG